MEPTQSLSLSDFAFPTKGSEGSPQNKALPDSVDSPESSSAPPASVSDFVRSVAPAARRVSERLGVPVEAVIGQWGLETGWGKSVIKGTNNLGNIKDFSGGGVAATDNMNGSRDKYRQYESVDQFADDFTRLLSTGRYKGAVGAKDAQSYFAGLKAGGYAEDPAYVQSGTKAAAMAAKALGGVAEASDLPDLAKAPKWADITKKPEFLALDDATKRQAKEAYFDHWIAPHAGGDRDALRQQFLDMKDGPGLIDQAKEVLTKAGTSMLDVLKPAKPLMEGAATPPDQRSTVPVRPEMRAAFNAQWDAATPEQRQQIAALDDWRGQLARERDAAFAKAPDLPTAAALDPRAEARRARLVKEGLDPTAAAGIAPRAARAGILPGQEVSGSVQESTYDFDTKNLFDPSKGANGLNNPLARGIAKGGLGLGKAVSGYTEFVGDVLGIDGMAAAGKDAGGALRGKEQAIGERGAFLERNVEGAINSITQQLPLLLAGVSAGQAVPLAGMAFQSFGQEYSDGKAQGQDAGQAATRAGIFAAFEVIGEKFGLGETLQALKGAAKGMPTDQIAAFLWSALKKEVPGELLTTTGQFGTDKFAPGGVGLTPDATGADYLKQVGDTIAQTILQSGMMAGGTTGVSAGVRFFQDRDAAGAADGARAGAMEAWQNGLAGRPAPEATVTPDGRMEPTIEGGVPVVEPEAPQAHPTVQTADQIVRELAEQAGVPVDTVLPSESVSDAEIAAFAKARQQRLQMQRDGTVDTLATPDGLIEQETPAAGLTPAQESELAAIQGANNPAALRALYGGNIEDQQNEIQDQAAGPASGQDAVGGQPAAGQAVSGEVQPAAPAADAGVAVGEPVQQVQPGQAVDPQAEADVVRYLDLVNEHDPVTRQAAIERAVSNPEAMAIIRNEIEKAAEQDAIRRQDEPVAAEPVPEVPFEPAKPKTEKEARARRAEKETRVTETPQAQQAEAQGQQAAAGGAVERGTVGMKLAAGQVVMTSSGRETTPFPKFDMGTERKAGNGLKKVNDWLIHNAYAEAVARGDEFNARQFGSVNLAMRNISQADKDSAEEYLFGEQPRVVPSILRPLSPRTEKEAATAKAKAEFQKVMAEAERSAKEEVAKQDAKPKTEKEAKAAKKGKGVTWDNIAPGQQVTLYRGESSANDANGQWWTTDRRKAERYGDVREVTLPAEVVGAHAVRGHNGADEFVFPSRRPADLASKNEAADGEKPSPQEALDAELQDALGHLGDVLGDVFGAKMNITGKQHSAGDLLPALSKVIELLVRKGFTKFADATAQAAKAMRGNEKTAPFVDQISPRQWKAAYNAIAEYHDGADSEEAVSAMTADQVRAVVGGYTDGKGQENTDVADQRRNPNLERNRRDAEPQDKMGEGSVQHEPRSNDGSRKSGVLGAQQADGRSRSGELPGREAAASGERGDLSIYTGSTESAERAARSELDQRGRDVGFDGAPIESIPAGAVEKTARSGVPAPVTASSKQGATLEDIQEELPQLLPGQQEDVLKAETRFSEPEGYGMLFTNGTGTGKTFTGLGIAKRFDNRGKGNILIVAPSDKIIADWVSSGATLGLNITPLSSTRDAGKGAVITTYANLGSNMALADREWDLVIADEAHYLSQDKDGTATSYLRTLRAITKNPAGVHDRHAMLNADLIDDLKQKAEAANLARMSDNTLDRANIDRLEAEEAEASKKVNAARDQVKDDVATSQGAGRPRALFLSATPFAYVKTVDWANGFLFDYNEGQPDENRESRGYNSGSNRDRFFMQHFGYRMRTGKLSVPEAKVDSGLMERQFNAWLKRQGVLSGRMLDVPFDYDRKFILVESAVGAKIDAALEWLANESRSADDGNNGYQLLRAQLEEAFDYQARRYLLEAIKANEVIDHVREHLAIGRKVVVFHDFKQGGGFNPFNFKLRAVTHKDDEEAGLAEKWNAAVHAFNKRFPDLKGAGFAEMPSPIEVFQREFPDVLLFNGDVPAKQRRANVEKFQDDASGPQVILVQSQAGKEGISLHDTTGKYQRVLFNLGQPTQPTTAIQQEGRIYRTGQKSDAIFRYLNTGTNWEKWAFATTIATRASTAENLGSGEQARALKDAFISSFEESGDYRAGMDGEGKGGKERDRAANDALTEYDRARAFYFGTQKKNSRTKAQEGTDYFATPEPVGLKMTEWADVRPGEKVLEPSAGHGAIARWFSEQAERTAVEPSGALFPRLAMVFDGKILNERFEDLAIVNKYDAIVMNPPFGMGGKTAIEHLDKASRHLREGGRIVALLPSGPAADKRLEKWLYGEESRPVKPVARDFSKTWPEIYHGDTVTYSDVLGNKVTGKVTSRTGPRLYVRSDGASFSSSISALQIRSVDPTGPRMETYRPAEGLHLVADITLPAVTFERAGTSVATHIIVLEKSDKALPTVKWDYSGEATIEGLFNRLEDAALPGRNNATASEESPNPKEASTTVAEVKVADKLEEATFRLEAGKIVTDSPAVTYKTQTGKTLEGVYVPDAKMAKEVDPYTFKAREMPGHFVRMKHVQRPTAGGMEFNDLARTPSHHHTGTPEAVRANALTKLKGLESKRESGKLTEAEYRLGVQQLIAQIEKRNDAREDRRVDAGRRRGADWIKAALRRGVADEKLERETADFADWLLDQNPNLAADLGISISEKDGNGVAGQYNPMARVVKLFSMSAAPTTAVHEILHHTERMMPGDVQVGLLEAWRKAWDAEYKASSAEIQKAMRDMLAASLGDKAANERVMKAFSSGVLQNAKHYPLYSPSEFWAVKATDILSDRFAARGSWPARAAQWLREFAQKVRAAFGLRSDAPLIRALDDLLAGGTGEVLSTRMLSERVGGRGGDIQFNDIARRVRNNALQFFGNRHGLKNFNAYDRTLSTQFNKALKDPHYGKVFGLVNAMQNEVSLTSIRPAELAPGVLPKVDDIKAALVTMAKGKTGNKDLETAAHAVFAGTLAGRNVMEGKVWTREEFAARFGDGEAAWGLYRQARAAIDASLDEVAAAEAYSMAYGYVLKGMRRAVIDDPQGAEALIVGELEQHLKVIRMAVKAAKKAGDEARLAEMEGTLAQYKDTKLAVEKIFLQAKNLKAHGYAPLMRFGKFSVTVQAIDPDTETVLKDVDGNPITEFYSQYETEAEAIEAKALQEKRFAGQSVRVTAGPKSQKAHELYAGISPETLALFAEAAGISDNEATKKLYQLAMSDRSALKRRLERNNIEGYTRDLPRVLSNFITSNGRFAAQRYYMRDINNAIKAIPKQTKGDVLDEAIKLKSFILNPADPAAGWSSLMFAWYLGGSVASAVVNLTQPIMMTAPYLSQFGNPAPAMAKALPYAMGKKEITDKDLRDALKRASQEGIVEAQEIFHLYSQGAQGVAAGLVSTLSKLPAVGKHLKAGSESARARVNAFLTLWGSMFAVAESFNRKLTFVAAWEMAKSNGDKNPYAFAVRTVNETQGIYNKVNRPNLARGPIGRTVMTFKQFSLMYLELLNRMWRHGGPEGKRAVLVMLAMLVLAAGEEGLPFAQDLDDLIDTFGQLKNLDTNMRRNKRRWAHEILGKELGDLALYGISSQLPLDFAGRLGLGNLVPGSGMFKKSAEDGRMREVTEAMGPAAGLVQQVVDAYDAATDGNSGKAVQNLMPTAVKNLAAGLEMSKKGYATDYRGRKVVDVTTGEAITKGIGFSPTVVAQEHRKTMPVQQDIALQKKVESSIVDQMARAVVDKDKEAAKEAQKRLTDWNKNNPQTPIRITPNQVRGKVRQMMTPKDSRVTKMAPREMRGRIGLELAD